MAGAGQTACATTAAHREKLGAMGKPDVDAGFRGKLFFTRPVEAFTPR
jgi:hypothetical protein